ncbi:uncharacterized protein CELE_Y42G9A.2 [Caenorhabditis elegans]|uniref:Secreted protein n=1 Tax=Caenorhabditis elegans TaxID=6239 RepID=Q9N4Z4_CAEEL|nr:Secreted protein [Caenorhabditis elegans]CCD71151.1 Secreted protein [Caenorhabditis elegans]|eukprot:NP_498331.1 Uncharacterized protein CELE_Y42G9A.2 [Caenorhabditis elegans]
MQTLTLIFIFSVILTVFHVECATRAPKLSKHTKKTVNKLVNCLTPVDTVLAAKTADCEDSICVSSAKQYAQRRYPTQYHSTVVPCLSSTTTLAPVTEKMEKTKKNGTKNRKMKVEGVVNQE